MSFDKFTDKARRVLVLAQDEARKAKASYVGTEHILLALAKEEEGLASKALVRCGVTYDSLRPVAAELTQAQAGNFDPEAHLSFSPRAKRVLEGSLREALQMGATYISTEHLLLGIAREESSIGVKVLEHLGVQSDDVRRELNDLIGQSSVSAGPMGIDFGSGTKGSALDEFGCDLTRKARQGKLDPVIGRSAEIERMMQIIARRQKNNPLLIGEPGVGKTAIVEGLAQLIVNDQVPDSLKNKRIFSLDIPSLVAGSRYRGDFEERMKKCLQEVVEQRDIILFLDEMHTLIGAGSAEGSIDAAKIIKPALSRGEICVIGATTTEEFRKYIEKDSALTRRFQTLTVHEPDEEAALRIVEGLREHYEAHHNITYAPEALKSAIQLSDRYIQDRFLPDKAIDVLDEAGARAHIKNQTKPDEPFTITEQHIADIVSLSSGVPVSDLTEAETEKLLRMEAHLHERIVGQDEAVIAVSKAIRRSRAGLKDPRRPAGSFIFLGPSGVGKTELSKTLAEFLFGTQDAMLSFDMSEYMEKHSVSRLVGSPPGYVGHDEGGQLTRAVRQRPYSVVLFDEIEKAHPDVFNLLLQILEEGRLTDSQGRVVDFKNTIIIMTSNVGARDIAQVSPLGFTGDKRTGLSDKELKARVMSELKKLFRPEFLNRLDEIIVFKALTTEEQVEIAKFMVADLRERLIEQNMSIEFTQEALEFVAQEGYEPIFGARPLRRALQRLVEDPLSEEILEGKFGAGSIIEVSLDTSGEQGKKLVFKSVEGIIPEPRRRTNITREAELMMGSFGSISSASGKGGGVQDMSGAGA